MFEIKYASGGHCGPYATWKDAILASFRHLDGLQYCPNESIKILPYFGVGSPKDTVQIIKAKHVCGCGLCQVRNEVFYHVRLLTNQGVF